MIPYWKSPLSVHAAQRYSKDGVAVFGNPAMRDVIWKKDDPKPLMWINKGYKEQDPARFRNRLGWVPNDPTDDYIQNEKEIFENTYCDFHPDDMGKKFELKGKEWVEIVPKPINTSKWKLVNNVYRYEKDGNWAEVDASLNNGFIPTKLCIKGEVREYIDHGWHELENAMDYCEWQVEHPDGIHMGWWGVTWRFSVVVLLCSLCLWAPWHSFIVYCILCYTLMAYLLLSGQLSSVGSIQKQIISGFFLWLLSPIFVPFLILWSCFAIL